MKRTIQKYSGPASVVAFILMFALLVVVHPQAGEVKLYQDVTKEHTNENETDISPPDYEAEMAIIEVKLVEEECKHCSVLNNRTCEDTEVEETVPEWIPYEFIVLSNYEQVAIKEAADRYQVSYDLIIAICMQESSLNPTCVGDCGKAFGLGQIREEYWSETAENLGLYEWRTDAVQNATLVCYIMSRQMNEFNQTMENALNIYRHGITQDIVEPDGVTYVQHIKNNLTWIEEEKEKN